MIRLLLTAVILSASFLLSAQPADSVKTNWATKGGVGFNFSQVGLTNWAGGGENSLALTGLYNQSFIYTKDIWTWDNSLDLAYGIIQQGDKPTRKSDDKLYLNSKLSRQFAEQWSFTGIMDFRTQFTDGFKYSLNAATNDEIATLISRFMSPAYLTTSIGLQYKPDEKLTVFVTPLTGKITFVLDDTLASVGAYGVDKGKNSKMEFGSYVVTEYNTPIFENVTLKSKLTLFSDYSHITLIDVNWENLILFDINKYMKASFTTNLVYDDDITVTRNNGTVGKDVQFKEVIAIGVSYAF